jgi:hypothetical protein
MQMKNAQLSSSPLPRIFDIFRYLVPKLGVHIVYKIISTEVWTYDLLNWSAGAFYTRVVPIRMDREFFERKVRELSDDKLLDLLRLRYDANREIIDLAIAEAKKRGLDLPEASIPLNKFVTEQEEMKKLEKWNWGAFLLAPIWTLSNKLEKWTILTFIPGVNIPTVIYLGLKGNRLAYNKSEIRNIDQFMTLQGQWNTWGIRFFWIALGVSILGLFISFFGG